MLKETANVHIRIAAVTSTSRGSGVECVACLDVLVARNKLAPELARDGKAILLEVVSMTAGLIARFSGEVHEERASYDAAESHDQLGEKA
ncbi:MAG: hypothetical protein NTX09_00525 [Verrucomicrobia bacterium]|nr:hypothetical protein [Verrucomicrobiota bacterium]